MERPTIVRNRVLRPDVSSTLFQNIRKFFNKSADLVTYAPVMTQFFIFRSGGSSKSTWNRFTPVIANKMHLSAKESQE